MTKRLTLAAFACLISVAAASVEPKPVRADKLVVAASMGKKAQAPKKLDVASPARGAHDYQLERDSCCVGN
jgi:hypothetical protein